MKKTIETKSKTNLDNYSSLRVKLATKEAAMKILDAANKKDYGRKVSMEDLVTLAINNVTKEGVEILQKQSLRNKDRQDIMRQIYCKKIKKVTEDEFIGVTMSDGYFQFMKDNKTEFKKMGI